MEVAVDKQGRIVIPKEVREKYGLFEESRLDFVPRDGLIELISLGEEDDLAIRSMKEPCVTGDTEAHDKAFSRERARMR